MYVGPSCVCDKMSNDACFPAKVLQPQLHRVSVENVDDGNNVGGRWVSRLERGGGERAYVSLLAAWITALLRSTWAFTRTGLM